MAEKLFFQIFTNQNLPENCKIFFTSPKKTISGFMMGTLVKGETGSRQGIWTSSITIPVSAAPGLALSSPGLSWGGTVLLLGRAEEEEEVGDKADGSDSAVSSLALDKLERIS